MRSAMTCQKIEDVIGIGVPAVSHSESQRLFVRNIWTLTNMQTLYIIAPPGKV